MIDLIWPWLLALIPIPLVSKYWGSKMDQTPAGLIVPTIARFKAINIEATSGVPKIRWKKIFLWAAWSLLVLGASRPVWVGPPQSLPTTGRDMIIAVDISGSMGTEDLILDNKQTTRLSAVKKVVNDFIDGRVGDRIGLILFGTKAYLNAPLTFDLTTVKQFLNESPIGIAGGKTALGDAIGLATKRLVQQSKGDRILILLTDGANNTGRVAPLKAAQLASQADIRIHTIGVGSTTLQLPGLFARRLVNPSTNLDENTLEQIAELTGGQYYRAENTERLIDIYRIIDSLEPIQLKDKLYRPTTSLFHWPLSIAWIILISLLTNTILRQEKC